MVDHVAKTLCRAASALNRRDQILCPICDKISDDDGRVVLGECSMWPTFVGEAKAAIEAVRDYARLDMRKRPRERTAVEVLQALNVSPPLSSGA